MGSVLSALASSITLKDQNLLLFSWLVGSIVAISIVFLTSSSLYFKCMIKRFIRIQLQKRVFAPRVRASKKDIFTSYYRNTLSHLQQTNNEFLAKVLQNNYSSAFFRNRSISFLSSHRPSSCRSEEKGYATIDEFREKVPLTTYDDYRDYIDQMVRNGETNILCSQKIKYFAASSGTTGKAKLLPTTTTMVENIITLSCLGLCVIWRSLPSLYPSPEQRAFLLNSGKKPEMYSRTKNGIPIGPISQCFSVVPLNPITRMVKSSQNILAIDLIEEIPDFETNAFVQLVFALACDNIYSYSVMFAPSFIHTVKIIEKYFEEMSLCIASTNFDNSPFVRDNIRDSKLRTKLSRALQELTIEYGGLKYQLKRAEYIRKECQKKNVPGILHRLWPKLVYATTTTGSSFAIYKEEIQFYCGEKILLINYMFYATSEGFVGSLASIHTDEYFLSPVCAFFEFIKEEDFHQAQPKTLLISEIEPGNRYELVCTTETGLIRYRLGDIINCTRFVSRADDLVPLPFEPVDIPRVPLISIAYRIGSLLDIFGEKTNEQHVMNALKQTIHEWRKQGISVDICDFTSYPKLDVFPSQYVLFLELIDVRGCKIDEQKLQVLQKMADSEVDRQLCKANERYDGSRNVKRLGPLTCILVRSGTFSTFLQKELLDGRSNILQIKPYRLLKNEHDIQFFYDNKIDTSSC